MYIYLSKLLPLLVLPLGVVMIAIMVALLLLWTGRRRTSAAILVVGLLVLWLSSTPIIAAALYGKLTEDYPPVALVDIPGGDCIILLGGVVSPAQYPRVDIEFNESVDRVYKAAQLYRAGKGQVVIVTAGNQPWSTAEHAEAELIQSLLVEWGVPVWSIAKDGASRNTRENALNTKDIIGRLDCKLPLLVTSAAHMPRSVAAFEKVGIAVYPVSTDVRVVQGVTYTVFDFLPQARALSITTDVMREWIGQKVYQLRGW